MDVVVFDADVLIAFRSRADASHEQAVEHVKAAIDSGSRRVVSAVNYSELLIGPLRNGGVAAAERVDVMLAKLGIELVPVEQVLARGAAVVRERTGLRLPDAYVVATALHARLPAGGRVDLASFDKRVLEAHEKLSAEGLPPRG